MYLQYSTRQEIGSNMGPPVEPAGSTVLLVIMDGIKVSSTALPLSHLAVHLLKARGGTLATVWLWHVVECIENSCFPLQL